MRKLAFYTSWLLLYFVTSCGNSTNNNPAVRIRLAQDPESLHPINYANAYSLQLLNLIYQSLLTVNLKDHSAQPLLVEALPTVEVQDSLSYFRFKIRPEAKWDNGNPVTGLDVAFSLKVLQSPALENDRWRAQYHFIKDIKVDQQDPHSFTIICSGYAPEMRIMVGDFFVLPQYRFDPQNILTSFSLPFIRDRFDSLARTTTFKSFSNALQNPTLSRDTAGVKGSGPYKLISWSSGQHVLLQRKNNWWGDQVNPIPTPLIARPDQLLFQIIPDDAAATLALKAGQLDLMDNIPLVAYQEMKRDRDMKEKIQFFSPATYDLVFLGMNGASPVLEDKKTRRAIAHLFDIPQIIKTLQGGYATATIGVVHPTVNAFYHHQLQPIPYNTSKAVQLLKAAGWKKKPSGWTKHKGGREIKLALELIHRAGNSDFENMGLLLQQAARSIGVPISIGTLESSQISERLNQGNFQLYFRTLTTSPFSYNLLPLLHTSSAKEGGANVTHFGNKETDRLLERIAKTESPAEQGELLKQLQERMQEESNFVFLYFLQNKIAISKRIDSVVVSSIKPNYDLSKLIIKKE
ncbi:ABC transporter substrate-binding protein [Rufibacter ruber]|uniref:ABC transporter substrate-binding protein n=1 Tax=Rufibacter ruber TaxID=1783499 RepID=UPI0009ED9F38|nr:ABC transporter substrate-binding protein [Rufibacter ruber]